MALVWFWIEHFHRSIGTLVVTTLVTKTQHEYALFNHVMRQPT